MQKRQNLIDRAKELDDAIKLESRKMILGKNKNVNKGVFLLNNSFKEVSPLFISSDALLLKAKQRIREELPLLERDVASTNEFVKKERLERPHILTIEEFATVEPYDDKIERLIYFADKYRIPYFEAGKRKTYANIAKDVHNYETVHRKKLKKLGLDKKYKVYGHYITYV